MNDIVTRIYRFAVQSGTFMLSIDTCIDMAFRQTFYTRLNGCADRFDAEEDEDEQDSSEEPKAKVRAKKSKLASNGEEKEKKPRAPGKPVR